MAVLNQQFLQSLGIQMPDKEAALLSDHFESTLDERVMNEVVKQLDDDQLEALTQLKDQPSEELAAWLAANVPELKEIIEDETAILLGELAENSEHF